MVPIPSRDHLTISRFSTLQVGKLLRKELTYISFHPHIAKGIDKKSNFKLKYTVTVVRQSFNSPYLCNSISSREALNKAQTVFITPKSKVLVNWTFAFRYELITQLSTKFKVLKLFELAKELLKTRLYEP